MGVRVCQHKRVSIRTGKELKVKVRSEIRHHSLKCKSKILDDNFETLDKFQSKNGILLLESLPTKIKKPKIGTHQQSDPLLCFD